MTYGFLLNVYSQKSCFALLCSALVVLGMDWDLIHARQAFSTPSHTSNPTIFDLKAFPGKSE